MQTILRHNLRNLKTKVPLNSSGISYKNEIIRKERSTGISKQPELVIPLRTF